MGLTATLPGDIVRVLVCPRFLLVCKNTYLYDALARQLTIQSWSLLLVGVVVMLKACSLDLTTFGYTGTQSWCS
jgi:hypothetical protein